MKRIVRFALTVVAIVMIANDSPDFNVDFRINLFGVLLAMMLMVTSRKCRQAMRSLLKIEKP